MSTDDLLAGLTLTLTLADRRKGPRAQRAGVEAASPVKKNGTATTKTAPPAALKAQTPARFEPAEWTPLDRLVFIGHQFCPCCGSGTDFIAGDLIRFTQRAKCAGTQTYQTRAFKADDKRDSRFTSLPRTFERLPAEERECPSCLLSLDAVDRVTLGGPVQFVLPGV